MTSTTALHPCPVDGCVIFPWEDAESLAEHLAAGVHPTWASIEASQLGTLAAGLNTDAPERHDGASASRPSATTLEVTLAKDDRHGWVLRVPAGAGAEGDTVVVHKRSGETAEVTLGSKIGSRKGDALHTPAKDAPAATGASQNPATERQVAFASRLAAERGSDPAHLEAIARNDRTEISALIDHLLTLPKAQQPAAPAQSPGLELEVGRVYFTTDGLFVRIYESQAGRLYGKARSQAGGWQFERGLIERIDPNADPARIAEAAATWGHEHERCVFCATPLEDDGDNRSKMIGYGPICASKYGLPWG